MKPGNRSATLDGLVSALQGLAASGYVITALGRDGTGVDGGGGFVAVGTRPTGQTAPRSLMAIDQPCVPGGADSSQSTSSLFADGYAVVGSVFHGGADCDGALTWLLVGER